MAPTLVASYEVDSGASRNTTALTTPSFTPSVGEIIVVKRMTEDSGSLYSGAPSGGSLTYTSRVSSSVASQCAGDIYTAVGAGSSMTVTSGALGTASLHSMIVERWSNAQLAATPATASGTSAGGNSAANISIVTVASNSVVSACCGDWNGGNPTGRAYRSSATEDGLYDRSSSGDTVHFYFWHSAVTTGSQAVGFTTPTMRWTALGIEVQAAGGVTPLPELVMQPMR
jgi:hypothetical protein